MTPPKKLVRTTSRGPYYTYEDADTGEPVIEIHQDLNTPAWRVSVPGQTHDPHSGIDGAARQANRILRRKGYEEIKTPSP